MDSARPTADLAASSFPPLPGRPIPQARPVQADALLADMERYAASQRQTGALDMALHVVRALKHATAAEVLATLRALEGRPDFVPAVLRSLEDLADRMQER